MLRAILNTGLALFALLLAGCERSPPAVAQTVTLAVAQQPTSVLYFIALEHKLFEKHGLIVDVKIYPSGKRALEEGLLTGDADIANPFDAPLALDFFDHPELRVLASTVISDNFSSIVARRDRGIAQPKDLRGRRIGIQAGSAVHFFLYQYLLEQGLSAEEVTLEPHKIEDLPALLEAGRVDAVGLREPYLSQCLEKLDERSTVFTAPGLYEQTELVVTNEKLLRERPTLARAVLAALLEAETYAKEPAAAATLAHYLNISVQAASEALSSFRIRVEMRQALLLLLEELARWGILSGQVKGEVPDYLDTLAPNALADLVPERVNLIR